MLRARLSLILCGLLLTAFPLAVDAKRGDNAFNTVFKEDAVGRHDGNAYMLTYLVTLIFPEYLDQLGGSSGGRKIDRAYVRELHLYPDRFLAEYRKLTEYLFYDPAQPASVSNPRPQYAFIQGSDGTGYDPEAVVIGTPKAVVVVIRGTDRVAAARSDFNYGVAEWIKSDFEFFGKEADVRGVPGKVHKGFWYSLKAPTKFWGVTQPPDQTIRTYQVGGAGQDNEFRERVFQQIVAFGGASKKLWIVGHSLGAAQTQTMAMWLDARVDRNGNRQGIRAQGAYAVAAPHVGNKEFVKNLEGRFQGQRLQRFDFVDDPVTILPPYAIGYERAGARVYYDDVKTMQFAVPERFITDDVKIVGAVGGALTDASAGWMTDGNKYIKVRAASAIFCYHYPHWYLNAAYTQLSKAERPRVPLPLGAPTIADFYRPCSPLDVARGHRNPAGAAQDVIDEGVERAKEAVETVVFNASNLLANANGSAISEGTYFIRCLQGRKYLDVSGGCVNENGCKVQLWDIGKSTGNNKFVVKKQGLGYTLRSGAQHFVEVDADDLFDNSARVQVWEPNIEIPFVGKGHASNQVWYFYKIPNTSDRYLIMNEASGKVLDANDDCTDKNGCKVKQYSGRSNDPTQVWIVEKAP